MPGDLITRQGQCWKMSANYLIIYWSCWQNWFFLPLQLFINCKNFVTLGVFFYDNCSLMVCDGVRAYKYKFVNIYIEP